MTYFALNVQRYLVPDDQQVLVLVPEDQQALVLVPGDQQTLVLVPGDQQALVLVPDDQQALVLHPKNRKKANVMVKGQTVLSQVNYYLCKCGHGVLLGILPR
jgi:predicted nucleic acid-binding protein